MNILEEVGKLISNKNYLEAINKINSALEENKNLDNLTYDLLIYNRANTYMDINNYIDAIKDLKSLLLNDSENYTLYYMIGLCYYELVDYDKALEFFLKSNNLNPNHSFTLNNIGLCFLHKKNYLEAINRYEKAFYVSPKDIDIINNLAMAFHYLERYNEALEYFDLALKINPNDKDIINKKERLLEIINSKR